MNQIDNIEIFSKFLEKYKLFRELPEQYKSTKFIKLYMKMYNYMLSIPKEQIVISHIVKRNEYINYMFSYIKCFLEAKDFYDWKNRVYSLVTEKSGTTSKRKYELLYSSKAKEFFDQYQEKIKATNLEKYGEEYAIQSKEIHEKAINTWKKNYGPEIINPYQAKEIKEKSKITNIKNRGVEYPAQDKQVREKQKATNLRLYGKEYVGGWLDKNYNIGNHSKECDEFCKYIDNILGNTNSKDTYYAIKNGEFYLVRKNSKKYYYDYVNTKYKYIIEFDSVYWHALDKDDNEIIKLPGNRIVLVKDIHKRDKEKEELAIQNGYKVFHIRDDDYKSNKSNCLKQLLKEIKNYVHSLENRI